MRFMFIMQTETDAEAAPPPAMIAAMHEMAQEEVAAGRMIYDGGLAPTAMGKRMRLRARKLTVTDGPFAETREVIGGFAIFELPDMAAAEESARRFMALQQAHLPDWEGVCEIRQVTGSQVEAIRAAG